MKPHSLHIMIFGDCLSSDHQFYYKKKSLRPEMCCLSQLGAKFLAGSFFFFFISVLCIKSVTVPRWILITLLISFLLLSGRSSLRLQHENKMLKINQEVRQWEDASCCRAFWMTPTSARMSWRRRTGERHGGHSARCDPSPSNTDPSYRAQVGVLLHFCISWVLFPCGQICLKGCVSVIEAPSPVLQARKRCKVLPFPLPNH